MDENATGSFRGSVFGGFNRADVVEYIRKTSVQYSECRREKDELQQSCDKMAAKLSEAEEQADALKAENEELRARAALLDEAEKKAEELQKELNNISESAKAYDETKQRLAELEVAAVRRAAEIEKNAWNSAESTLDQTDSLIGDINDKYNGVKDDVEDTIAHLRGELEKISESLANLVSVLGSSAFELSEFRDKAYAARETVLSQKGE